MHFTKESGQDLVLLLLDFEKAFDRISWDFLEVVMEKRRFHEDFIRGVMSIYKNTSSVVIVNAVEKEGFDLLCSVCQGCPLTPLLIYGGIRCS